MIIMLRANIAIVDKTERKLKDGLMITVSWATLAKALARSNITIDGVEKIEEFEVTDKGLKLLLGSIKT